MSLAGLTSHLESLSTSTSGLKRSRAMAQLWSEVRSSSPEERRIFALALSDRFAPGLSAGFADATGLDGPEFIKLVRSLIEMDPKEIRGVVDELIRLRDDQVSVTDEVTVAELVDTADQMTTESGRGDLTDEVFKRLVARASGLTGQTEADEVGDAVIDGLDEEVLKRAAAEAAVKARVPHEPVVSAFDLAMEHLEEIQEEVPPPIHEDVAATADVEMAVLLRPDATTPPIPSPPPLGVENALRTRGWEFNEPESETTASADDGRTNSHRSSVEAQPDGWRRRRMISSLIREKTIGVREALDLSSLLGRSHDRSWILGDLIQGELTIADRTLLADRELPAVMRRRLEAI